MQKIKIIAYKKHVKIIKASAADFLLAELFLLELFLVDIFFAYSSLVKHPHFGQITASSITSAPHFLQYINENPP